METALAWLHSPWPWYVAGPLIGLMVSAHVMGRQSLVRHLANLRHMCAIAQPKSVSVEFFQYNWREQSWSLVFAGGARAGWIPRRIVFANPEPIDLSVAALTMFSYWNVPIAGGYLPPVLFDLTWMGVIVMFVGGVLVGFRYPLRKWLPPRAMPLPDCPHCSFSHCSPCWAFLPVACSPRTSSPPTCFPCSW